MTNDSAFEGWAILELMGHRRLAGYVSEQMIAGQGVIRLDIPGDKPAEVAATQFYSPAALYCLTPSTEETVRQLDWMGKFEPVQSWELAAPKDTAAGAELEQAREQEHDAHEGLTHARQAARRELDEAEASG